MGRGIAGTLLGLLGRWGRNWVKERGSCGPHSRGRLFPGHDLKVRKKDPPGLSKSASGSEIPSSARCLPVKTTLPNVILQVRMMLVETSINEFMSWLMFLADEIMRYLREEEMVG